MKKNLFETMKQNIAETLSSTDLELLGMEEVVKENEDGTKEFSTRLELEVPKGNGIYSRCRFSCKMPYSSKHFTAEELEEGVLVTLKGLSVSYIDAKGNVYFKCESII